MEKDPLAPSEPPQTRLDISCLRRLLLSKTAQIQQSTRRKTFTKPLIDTFHFCHFSDMRTKKNSFSPYTVQYNIHRNLKRCEKRVIISVSNPVKTTADSSNIMPTMLDE